MRERLMSTFGFCAVSIGILLIIKVHSLAAVALSLILGVAVGGALGLEDRVKAGFGALFKKLAPHRHSDEGMNHFIVLLVLFCTGGTGIVGSIQEGLTGDSSTLIVKSVLDFFTAAIFASGIGWPVAVIALPQAVIFLSLFFASRLLVPILAPEIVANFTAAGGIIALMSGLRILKLKETKLIDVLPALVFVFPVSWLWLKLAALLG
jgi:uncharacterized membrane protein YqgA involved in biofilm formation